MLDHKEVQILVSIYGLDREDPKFFSHSEDNGVAFVVQNPPTVRERDLKQF